MTISGYWILAAVILTAAGVVLWYQRQTRRILESLDRMLEVAIQGDFTEKDYDESMLSALEVKLARYLASSTVSAKNLQSEKDSIKTLIADISHQTKTPIANILLYTQLLEEQALPEESRICAVSLEHQAEKMKSLIDALVKTSRLETGILALHPEAGQLESVILSAVAQLSPKAERKGIRILIESADGDAVFDPKWTEEAFFNLLDNAVKYTPTGGEVRIRTVSYPLFSAVQVSDTGPGIPEEEQPKVFQRFYRGLEHQQEDGVGIGLYLVRQIAQGQGGYVKVVSQKGAGSTFSLYLPRN
ncbi:MAG: sensor histidine kinase [Faecousia sp.]